jgi:hypothetical protein
MEHTQDIEMILSSLNKDKRELLDKVNAIDKLIKRIKYGNLNLGLSKVKQIDNGFTDVEVIEQTPKPQAFPLKSDLKIQAIKIMDMLGVACKLNDVTAKYKEITGLTVNFRETLRTLKKHDILKLLYPKGNMRSMYWIKSEWLDNDGRLKDNHKFEGFDLLYTDDMIEFK